MAKTVTIQAQQKWDCRCESRRTEASLLVAMNEQGQHGWEPVNVVHHKDPKGEMMWSAFLKRPSVSQSAAPAPPSTGTSAVVLPSPPVGEKPVEPQGFDLSENEFQLKTN